MSESKPMVVVLAGDYAAGLAAVRALGAAGYPAELIAAAKEAGESAVAAASKYVRRAQEVIAGRADGGREALVEALLAYAGREEKPVLLPADESAAALVAQCAHALNAHFILPEAKEGTLRERVDGDYLAKLARDAGMPMPHEWTIDLSKEIVIPMNMVYPCICEPIGAMKAESECLICESETELAVRLNDLRSTNAYRPALVREYVESDADYCLCGVCMDQEIVLPAAVKTTISAHFERGAALTGRLVHPDELGDAAQAVAGMLRQMRYVGPVTVQMSMVSGSAIVRSVHLCSGVYSQLYALCGVNLPALFVKAATGKRVTPKDARAEKFGKAFVNEKAVWQDVIHGHVHRRAAKKLIAAAEQRLIVQESDPAPGELFAKRVRTLSLRYGVRQFKGGVREYIIRPLLPTYEKVKGRILNFPQLDKKNQRSADAPTARVMICGRNYCSNLCLARAFGQAGYEVEIMRVFQTRPKLKSLMRQCRPDIYSKYIKAYYECNTRKKAEVLVEDLIAHSDKDRKMLLIPADDLAVSIVDTNLDRLKEYYLIPSIGYQQGAIDRLMNKETQMELAREAGLPVIPGTLIRTECGRFELPDSISYPCFIKPNISKNGLKSKMKRCETREELQATIEEYSKARDIEMLVEDFVDIKKEYALLGVSTKDGVIAPGLFLAEAGGHGSRKGVAMMGRILDIEPYAQLLDDICKFIGTLNYEGLYDVDLIETADGKIYFVELNLRYGGSGYAVVKSGTNLPGMFADHMLKGKPIDLDCRIGETGKVFVSEKIMIEEYAENYITYSELQANMKKADIHFIYDKDDMHPYTHFRKFYPVAAIKRRRAAKPTPAK